jgi:flagellin-specific chaperone FliS
MKQGAITRYIERQVTGMQSLDIVIGMLDYCLFATSVRDASKTTKGLIALEESLDFHDSPELARLFRRVYEYCRHLAWEGRFDEAHNCLSLLRDAWGEAKQRRNLVSGQSSRS